MATVAPVQTLVTDRGPVAGEIPVTIVTLSPLQIIGIRALRTYLQSILGLFIAANIAQAAGLTPAIVGSNILQALELAAVASTAPAIVSLLQNSVELLASLDTTNPKLRG